MKNYNIINGKLGKLRPQKTLSILEQAEFYEIKIETLRIESILIRKLTIPAPGVSIHPINQELLRIEARELSAKIRTNIWKLSTSFLDFLPSHPILITDMGFEERKRLMEETWDLLAVYRVKLDLVQG
jgi:hypothetical protein